jgi:hypothetical protein
MNGQQLAADIYIGPTYYMRLKHMVKDKINYRARGPNTVLTRQPVQGRANDGGLRIGEMERDGVMGHGMSYFLNESLMVRGEKQEFYIAVCNKTGSIAIYNESKNLFLSPLADGPIKFNMNPDGSQSIINLSRFGRSFSILKVPYAFKLLMQELQVMNVQMRIITEENVDQLLNMSFSNNVNKLTGVNEEFGMIEDLLEAIKTVNLGIINELYKSNPNDKNTESSSILSQTPEESNPPEEESLEPLEPLEQPNNLVANNVGPLPNNLDNFNSPPLFNPNNSNSPLFNPNNTDSGYNPNNTDSGTPTIDKPNILEVEEPKEEKDAPKKEVVKNSAKPSSKPAKAPAQDIDSDEPMRPPADQEMQNETIVEKDDNENLQ